MSRIEDYRKCAALGMTAEQTAELLGGTSSACRQAARRYRFQFHQPIKPRRPSWETNAHNDVIREMAKAGETISAISRATGLHRPTIHTKLRRMASPFKREKPLRKKPYALKYELHLTPKEIEDFRFLRRKGYNIHDALIAIKRADLVGAKP